MSEMRKDPRIGKRAAGEFHRLCGEETAQDTAERIGLTVQAVQSWGNGVAPGGFMLKLLHEAGADVLYILTGRRTEGNELCN